jgi:hypothetical protein
MTVPDLRKRKMRYGIYNNMKNKFQFGICEPTEKAARKALYKKIGKDSYRWRFEVRKIPTYFVVSCEARVCFWSTKWHMFRYGLQYATHYTSREIALRAVQKHLDYDDDIVYAIEEYTPEGKFIESTPLEMTFSLKG